MMGVRNESVGSVHPLHSPHFRLDEGVLELGAALHVQFATMFLQRAAAAAAAGEADQGMREEL